MVSSLFLAAAISPILPVISGTLVEDVKSGCGSSLPEGVELDRSVNLTIDSSSGVSTRGYRLHLPESYDTNTKVPLILSFHGRGKDAKFQEELSQFSNATYGFDGISVYPEGVPVSLVISGFTTPASD
jgi:poly(3-hydroxybutyrate) depolymerase